jgi:phage/plasmid-associated DNA primase
MDNAFTKRLRCINFPTEFVPCPKLPNQKKIDETLQTKLILWKNDFMLLLLDYYKIFKEGNLAPPPNVTQWTKMYKEEVDVFYNFLNECTEDSEINISSASLYLIFKEWFYKNYDDEILPKNKQFLTGIKKYKNYSKSIWCDGKVTTGFKNLKLKD